MAAMVRVVEPATEEVMAELPQAGVDEADAAVARATRRLRRLEARGARASAPS